MRKFVPILFFWLVVLLPALTKFEKWQMPSFFRGFNTHWWSNVYDRPMRLEDIQVAHDCGANLMILQTQGFLQPEPPYDSVASEEIEGLDSLVSYCRQLGIYYVISVRSGPGRQDVWEEGEGMVPPSTIWQNDSEVQLYAGMLKGMAARYLPDTLFVGMDLIQEPNPYGDSVACMPPEELDSLYSADGIDVHHIYEVCIESVRTVAPELPLLVQTVHWSNPAYFSILQVQSDDKIVYDVHCYNPFNFTHADEPMSQSYPDSFWGCPFDWYAYWDRDFLRDTVLSAVRQFQSEHDIPIIMGECGLQYRQNGGRQYLSDLVGCVIEFGWHFALWQFRADPNFNYEIMGDDYWGTVCSLMTAPAVVIEDECADMQEISIRPNPFNSSCEIYAPENVEVNIYDLSGRLIYSAGRCPFVWKPVDINSGIYFVEFANDSKRTLRKVVYIKQN